jgi:MOSC domain-containing protein YiiM
MWQALSVAEADPAEGRLRSVNVGMPLTVPHGAATLHTAIFKSPVDGPVALRALGLDGDDQADRRAHGGPNRAAYAYRWEDYRWWMDHLGRDLVPGRLGENLTLEGLGDLPVHLGDRFRIGSALVEATSPRIPCVKLGMRMDDPDFPRRFREAGRSGFYLRVIEEGAIGAGDAWERTLHRPDMPDIEAMAGLQNSGGHDLELLRRVAQAEPATDEWRDWARTRLARRAAGTASA